MSFLRERLATHLVVLAVSLAAGTGCDSALYDEGNDGEVALAARTSQSPGATASCPLPTCLQDSECGPGCYCGGGTCVEGSRPPQSDEIAPATVDGNPRCADVGLVSATKIEVFHNGSYRLEEGEVFLTFTSWRTFDWYSTVPISAVIVKGGSSAHVYSELDACIGTELTSPLSPGNQPAAISHIEFCQ